MSKSRGAPLEGATQGNSSCTRSIHSLYAGSRTRTDFPRVRKLILKKHSLLHLTLSFGVLASMANWAAAQG